MKKGNKCLAVMTTTTGKLINNKNRQVCWVKMDMAYLQNGWIKVVMKLNLNLVKKIIFLVNLENLIKNICRE